MSLDKEGLAERAQARRKVRRNQARANTPRRTSLNEDRKAALAFFFAMSTNRLIKLKNTIESCQFKSDGRSKPLAWTPGELEMLKQPLSAAEMVVHLPGRSMWAIGNMRRKLGLKGTRGARQLDPQDFPDCDWSLPIGKLVKSLGVCFRTARKLKLLAIQQSTDSLQSG